MPLLEHTARGLYCAAGVLRRPLASGGPCRDRPCPCRPCAPRPRCL